MKTTIVMKRRVATGLLITAVTLTTAGLFADDNAIPSSGNPKQGELSEKQLTPDSFIKEAWQINCAEVALGKLAAEKSQNSETKQFAEHMQKDHQAANDQLKPIAEKHSVQIGEKLDAMHQAKYDKLEKLSGAEFDKEYATAMLKGHQKAIHKFETASKQLQDSDVKDYASNLLPKLREHLSHAQTTAKAVGVDEATIKAASNETEEAVGGTTDSEQKETGEKKQGEKKENYPPAPPNPDK